VSLCSFCPTGAAAAAASGVSSKSFYLWQGWHKEEGCRPRALIKRDATAHRWPASRRKEERETERRGVRKTRRSEEAIL
jgi:hypothetical protein